MSYLSDVAIAVRKTDWEAFNAHCSVARLGKTAQCQIDGTVWTVAKWYAVQWSVGNELFDQVTRWLDTLNDFSFARIGQEGADLSQMKKGFCPDFFECYCSNHLHINLIGDAYADLV